MRVDGDLERRTQRDAESEFRRRALRPACNDFWNGGPSEFLALKRHANEVKNAVRDRAKNGEKTSADRAGRSQRPDVGQKISVTVAL